MCVVSWQRFGREGWRYRDVPTRYEPRQPLCPRVLIPTQLSQQGLELLEHGVQQLTIEQRLHSIPVKAQLAL